MNYIVLDLEWNQCPDGKEKRNPDLPFEIIEIGAVKLDKDRRLADIYQEYVKPEVYQVLHTRTQEVINLEYRDLLEHGRPFPQVVREFLEWCGDGVFCTWGDQDLVELQKNMKYYGLLEYLRGPLIFYDVQKIFALSVGDGRKRDALETAVDRLRIEKEMSFHHALADAAYTAQIFQRMEETLIEEQFSIDTYQNPKGKKEELHLRSDTYEQYVTREFPDKGRLFRDSEVCVLKCPLCRKRPTERIRWFTGNGKTYYSISSCTEHGLIYGKIRIRKSEGRKIYGVKKLQFTSERRAKDILQFYLERSESGKLKVLE